MHPAPGTLDASGVLHAHSEGGEIDARAAGGGLGHVLKGAGGDDEYLSQVHALRGGLQRLVLGLD